MLKRVPTRVACFVLLAACGALAQRQDDSQKRSDSLPDAPSAIIRASVDADTVWAAGTPADSTRVGAVRANLTAVYRDEPEQKEPGDFFQKYLYPSMLKRNLNYYPSSSSSLMGRAAYAASRIFVTRDDSGKGRLNTSYFLGVLSSAVVHAAYRPYWNRSVSGPFSDFGSTIGNDAGMNILHEFGPGLEQLMKSHAPRFVSRIEDRIAR
jgi:hypothetical protein